MNEELKHDPLCSCGHKFSVHNVKEGYCWMYNVGCLCEKFSSETDEERADRLIEKYFCLGPATPGAPPDDMTLMLLDAMREVRAEESEKRLATEAQKIIRTP